MRIYSQVPFNNEGLTFLKSKVTNGYTFNLFERKSDQTLVVSYQQHVLELSRAEAMGWARDLLDFTFIIEPNY